jgi:hypothetical protein
MTRLEFLEAMRESARSHLECEARTMLLTELEHEIKKETNKWRTNVTLILKKLSSVVALAVFFVMLGLLPIKQAYSQEKTGRQ